MNDFLIHYGVKGMKWGVRKSPNYATGVRKRNDEYEKYRTGANDNYTLIEKPKKRNVKTSSHTVSENRDRLNSARNVADATRNVTYSARETANSLNRLKKMRTDSNPNLSSISDAELKRAVNRMNLERQYNSLTKTETKNGYDYVSEILTTVGSVVGIAGGVLTIYTTIDALKHK